MRTRPFPHTTLALLVAGAGLLVGWFAGGARWPLRTSLDDAGTSFRASTATAARGVIEGCLDNVTMIHDVAWAAACEAVAQEELAHRSACLGSQSAASRTDGCRPGDAAVPDDSAECTLPDARARPLNAARSAAEAQCVTEAMAGLATR